LVIEDRGQQRVLETPLDEYPVYLPSPVWLEPGVVAGRPREASTPFRLEFRHLAGPTFEALAQQYQPCDFVGTRLSFSPREFARMLAKVAYCAAVHTIGISPLRQSPIRAVILGHDPAVAHWVGTWAGTEINRPSGLHAMQLRSAGSQLHVVLRLFAQFGAPEYHVVLGEASQDFVDSDAWPWKNEA
jgi:hypothetical protein